MQDCRLIILLVALALTGVGGCGEAEQKQKSPEEAMGFKSGGAAGSQDGAAPKRRSRRGRKAAKGLKANPAWDRILPHFTTFTTRMDDEIHNPALTWRYRDAFQDNLDKLFPDEPEAKKAATSKSLKTGTTAKAEKKDSGVKSILDALKKAGTQPIELSEKAEDAAATVDPLLKQPLSAYSFEIILSGTSNPEVQVVLPGGDIAVLHVNDRIGVEGGHIQDILKQEVLIKIPEVDEPQIVSLMPPVLPVEYASP